MLMVTLQIAFLLVTVFLPLGAPKSKKKHQYRIDTDTSEATYAINEHGILEHFDANLSEKNPRIQN